MTIFRSIRLYTLYTTAYGVQHCKRELCVSGWFHFMLFVVLCNLSSISTYTHSPATYTPTPMQWLTHPNPHPSYLHYTHTTITATIHCMPPLHLCISTHSSEHNMYYVAPEPNKTYNITLTNNYTKQRTT